jgi:hypothetical protein
VTDALRTNKPSGHPEQARRLVTYKEEGGDPGFRYRFATVSTNDTAAVTTGSCGGRYRPSRSLWKRLTAALKRTNMHTLAGNYPPRPDAAVGFFTYTITVGRDTVRITSAPTLADERVGRELEPLSRALAEVVTAKERRMPGACGTTHA